MFYSEHPSHQFAEVCIRFEALFPLFFDNCGCLDNLCTSTKPHIVLTGKFFSDLKGTWTVTIEEQTQDYFGTLKI